MGPALPGGTGGEGGLFQCGRCGDNMVGFKLPPYRYYVCATRPYRRGDRCGRGVYVPQAVADGMALEGIRDLVTLCSDRKGFVEEANEELRRIWEEGTGYDPEAERKIRAIHHKIINSRRLGRE